MSFEIVVAMDINGGIGMRGKIPWGKPIPADLKRFKELTVGEMVAMGRKTWESIGSKPLKNRIENIVLTRDTTFSAPEAFVINDFNLLNKLAQRCTIFGVGGAEIYSLLIPFATRMHITHVEAEFDCDTYFPEYDTGVWVQSSCIHLRMRDENRFGLKFVTLERVSLIR